MLWHIQERQAPAVGSQWAFCLAWLRACCSGEYREREREEMTAQPHWSQVQDRGRGGGGGWGVEERTRAYISLRSTAPLSVVLAFRSLDQPISSSLFDLEVSFLKPFSHLSLSLMYSEWRLVSVSSCAPAGAWCNCPDRVMGNCTMSSKAGTHSDICCVADQKYLLLHRMLPAVALWHEGYFI